ncbi:hypothetical protein [Aristophania vespae]|uniref:hypothetical protein n=1 Tax=Aristophania vespae TaxID=2697033 RepID=UPI002351AFC2|nr:hypothetical protein [Aristophania vespae]UMM64390.1 hypothetical protein DM15PD_14040 [Aristophania vespae]
MHNCLSLWKRAALWRLSLVLSILCFILAAYFPTDSLKKTFPWLPGQEHFTQQHSFQSKDQSHGDAREQLSLPDMQKSFKGSITLAGHTLPLPHGEWHPVVMAQSEEENGANFIALIRLDHSVVTGFITAQLSQKALPPILADDIMTPCHDDRNYFTTNKNVPGQINCSFLANAVMAEDVVSLNPFVHAAISRIRDAGLLIPPLMITAGWRHVSPLPSGQITGAIVDVLLSPLEQGTPRLLAPLSHWDKKVLNKDPAALNFINKAKEWLPLWSNLLAEGYNNVLLPSTSSGGKFDPASLR